MRNLFVAATAAFLSAITPCLTHADPGDPVYETCPVAEDVGANVDCYPVTFTARTEIHPDGIPLIGYLFVPKDRSVEPLSAIVFAHGSGSMYSSGNHNEGLNSKHKQWVRRYTNDLGMVSFHVSSFHSRYLLPDTEGDQRILDWEDLPTGPVGGDDYRATSSLGSRDDSTREDVAFDPDQDGWKDASNGAGGVSEVLERAYDMDAAWDFLAGIRRGAFIQGSRNEGDLSLGAAGTTLGVHDLGEGYVSDIVGSGIVIDHERIFMYGTSHGGQTAMTAAHADRALDPAGPMNADLPEGFNSRRYAGFFDYYGGCGLHGAYGGTSGSTWRPYAPFFMLHGDRDDEAVFRGDEVPVDSVAEFSQTGCGKRLAAAKADPDFSGFLEAIIYKDTFHSFNDVGYEDVEGLDPETAPVLEGGLNDWLAQVHANELVTIPALRAISYEVAQRRGSVFTNLSLAGLGLDALNPWFHTVPLEPSVPPTAKVPLPVEVSIPDASDDTLNLRSYVDDGYQGVYEPVCSTRRSVIGYSMSDDCVITFQMTSDEIASLATNPHYNVLHVRSPRGVAVVTMRLLPGSAASEIIVELRDALYTVSQTDLLSKTVGGDALFDVRALAWTSTDEHHDWYANYGVIPGSAFNGSDPDGLERNIHIGGVVPAVTPEAVEFRINGAGGSDFQGLRFDIVAVDDGIAEITCCVFVGTASIDDPEAPLPDPTLPTPDFAANFTALDPVDAAPVENLPPTAHAGADQQVNVGASATLDGRGSTDEDGDDVLAFIWQQTGGDAVSLLDLGDGRATFTASITGEFIFTLTVTDTHEATHSDNVKVTVVAPNSAPVADAGADREVVSGDSVTLTGAGSTDENLAALEYEWSQIEGVPITLADDKARDASFIAPAVTAQETLVFQLFVTDEHGLSNSADVRIVVHPDTGVPPLNSAPDANAGSDVIVVAAADVTLDGSGSEDPDSDPMTFHWIQIDGEPVELDDEESTITKFTAPSVDVETRLTFQVTVTDDRGLEDTDTVVVTVRPGAQPVNRPPVANAGEDRTVNAATSVTLNGAASSDPDDDALLFSWHQTGGPAVTLENIGDGQARFTAPAETTSITLEFSLTVTDTGSATHSDTVVITVKPKPASNGNGGGGGGAIFWLLPFAFLLQHRR